MVQQLTQAARKWQRPERTDADLNRICGNAFRALKIPAHWKFKEYDRIRLTEDATSEIQSIAAIFVDTKTHGFDLKHYRVTFHTYSERLSIVEVSFKDFGKPFHTCKACNKTPEQMNEFFETLK